MLSSSRAYASLKNEGLHFQSFSLQVFINMKCLQSQGFHLIPKLDNLLCRLICSRWFEVQRRDHNTSSKHRSPSTYLYLNIHHQLICFRLSHERWIFRCCGLLLHSNMIIIIQYPSYYSTIKQVCWITNIIWSLFIMLVMTPGYCCSSRYLLNVCTYRIRPLFRQRPGKVGLCIIGGWSA